MNINGIDKYWRAANYLTVSEMYLKKNKFLFRTLENKDLREYASSHWGTCPGINFIYTHLNRYICQYRRKTQLIIGPGHGGNAVMANMKLEQSMKEENIDFELKLSENVIIEQTVSSVRSEINPYMHGVIYDGGELGYSLPVAFGSVLDKPDQLCVCIIGDGEAETGTIAASWICKELLNRSSGFVLPILHLNGFKMGSKSLFSQKSDSELIEIFHGYGYKPLLVNANHNEMFNAMETVENTYREIEKGEHNQWPMIILRSPKGWSAPTWKEFCIEGRSISHKNPLGDFHSKETLEYLNYWLKSYHPEELFDDKGIPNNEVTSIIPDTEYCIGNALSYYERKEIHLPSTLDKYSINIQDQKEYKNILILEKYLSEIMRLNPDNFRIMSPDELQSNLLGTLKKVPVQTKQEVVDDNGRVLEVLNENVCQALMQGYVQTGRNSLMISYEAFMPIITSMVSQYEKWLFQAEQVKWRNRTASITYLVTSLCWTNTYSHQNPEFINSLISSQYKFIRIYTPTDANSLLGCMEQSLSSETKINLIVSSKQKMPQWLDLNTAQSGVKTGIIHWSWLEKDTNISPDVVIAASGDYPVRECMESISIIKEYLPNTNFRFISVEELTSIGPQSIYPHAIDANRFQLIFTANVPVIFNFHGYVSAIKMLLFDRIDSQRISFFGYNNKSIISTNDINKLMINGCSRYHIALEICRILYNQNKITSAEKKDIMERIENQIGSRYCS